MVAKLNNEPISPVVKLTQRALDKQKNLFTIPFLGSVIMKNLALLYRHRRPQHDVTRHNKILY